ncbi:hypothetical protein J2785_005375 [Burkholderia ambifaria]|nr:hypothetical protein [Burkholderia ambifaria]MDR6502195.1 hypothetical protein [Burkholderia ambifaria]
MCYSAKIQADYREYVRLYGADIDIETFRELYFERAAGGTVKIPKAVDVALLAAPASREIVSAIHDYGNRRTGELEAELFSLHVRLTAAERKLPQKVTKTASEDARIAKRVGDGVAPVALSHHRTCGSAYGGSLSTLEAPLGVQQRDQS